MNGSFPPEKRILQRCNEGTSYEEDDKRNRVETTHIETIRCGGRTCLIEPSDGMWARISLMAYELWEQRGRRHGYALQDWLDAEAMVREDLYEARQ